jgi:hypothetical protein
MIDIETRFWSKVKQTPHCWVWLGAKTSTGYGVIGRGRRGEGNARASHVSWFIHNGPIPTGQWLLHKCDNPTCVNPEHLFLGNHTDNMRDCVAKGRARRNPKYGEDHHSTKLSDAQVVQIKREWQDAPPRRRGRVAFRNEMCQKYGVSDATIKGVVGDYARRKLIKIG